MHIIYTTIPTKEDAISLAKNLLEKNLIACANFFPMESIYLWDDKMSEDKEYILLLKTGNNQFDILKEEITKNHPYEIPCIIKLEAEAAPLFGNWVNQQLK